jgi:hypothetical protein
VLSQVFESLGEETVVGLAQHIPFVISLDDSLIATVPTHRNERQILDDLVSLHPLCHEKKFSSIVAKSLCGKRRRIVL